MDRFAIAQALKDIATLLALQGERGFKPRAYPRHSGRYPLSHPVLRRPPFDRRDGARRQLGMSYITITDHSPSAHYAGGVSLERSTRGLGAARFGVMMARRAGLGADDVLNTLDTPSFVDAVRPRSQ